MKKSYLFYTLLVIIAMVSVWLANHQHNFAANFNGFTVVFCMLFLDFILWLHFFGVIRKYSKKKKCILCVLFWLPFMLFVFGAVYSFLQPFGLWPPTLQTWYLGSIFIVYSAKVLPVFIYVISDIIHWITGLKKLGKQKEKAFLDALLDMISSPLWVKFIARSGFSVVFIVLMFGAIVWPYRVEIKKLNFPLKDLPASFNGFRIVQISDLHLGSWPSKKSLKKIVSKTNDLNPDLIVFTGGLVTFTTKEAYPFREILGKLHSEEGVITILGNHDYGGYVKWASPNAKNKNLEDLFRLYQEMGWKLLLNESLVINKNGEQIAILGVENWGSQKRFPQRANLEKTLAQVENIPVKILLSHDPTYWEKIVNQRDISILLTLSGHTHGMQIGIETGNFRWSPAKFIYTYWSGLYKDSKTPQYLYVNQGLGCIGYPGRMGIWPEITLIELKVK